MRTLRIAMLIEIRRPVWALCAQHAGADLHFRGLTGIAVGGCVDIATPEGQPTLNRRRRRHAILAVAEWLTRYAASRIHSTSARMAKRVDAPNLKFGALWACRFDSGCGHHRVRRAIR